MSSLEYGNWLEMPWECLREGVKRTEFAIGADQVSCGVREYTVGHALHPHSHPNEQVSICLQGECDYYIDGKPYRMKVGSWVTIPAGVPHFIYAHYQGEPCLMMDVSAPARRDREDAYQTFLKKHIRE